MVKLIEPCGEHKANYSFALILLKNTVGLPPLILRHISIFVGVELNPLPSLV